MKAGSPTLLSRPTHSHHPFVPECHTQAPRAVAAPPAETRGFQYRGSQNGLAIFRRENKVARPSGFLRKQVQEPWLGHETNRAILFLKITPCFHPVVHDGASCLMHTSPARRVMGEHTQAPAHPHTSTQPQIKGKTKTNDGKTSAYRWAIQN